METHIKQVQNVWEVYIIKKLVKMLNERCRIVLAGVPLFRRIGLRLAGYSCITAMGSMQSMEELRGLYSSATVYVNTILEDNFYTTNLEALSCGRNPGECC